MDVLYSILFKRIIFGFIAPIDIIYLIAVILIASNARKKEFGFWKYFLLGFFLTPITSGIVLLYKTKKAQNKAYTIEQKEAAHREEMRAREQAASQDQEETKTN